MCSGSTREKDKERSRALGAVGYLAKPVRFDQLQPIITKSTHLRLAPDAGGPPFSFASPDAKVVMEGLERVKGIEPSS